MTTAPPISSSDAHLVEAFAARRDESAFAEIVHRHGTMVLSVCRAVLGNSSEAEDAAQAVFLTLALKASSHRARTSLAGWLHRVAWFVAVRASRARVIRRSREQEAARMKPESLLPDEPDIPPEDLHAALLRLPDKYRIPLILHHLEGRSQAETAALLNCNTSALAMRLNRGRHMLKARLARRQQPISDHAFSALLAPIAFSTLPPSFVTGATHAAAAAAAGKLASTVIVSTKTVALAKGAITMFFWSKVKLVAAVIAVVLLAGGATFVALAQSNSQIAGGGNITAVTANSVTIDRKGTAVTVTIDSNTVIKVDDAVKTAADLKTGLYAGAWGTGTSATEIRAYTPKPVTPPTTSPAPAPAAPIAGGGNITALTANSITITRGANPTTVTINANTTFTLDGKSATLADLKTGLYAGAWGTGTSATEIRAYTPKPK